MLCDSDKKADLRRLFCWAKPAYFFAGSAAGAGAAAGAASAAEAAAGADSAAGAGAASGAGAAAGAGAGAGAGVSVLPQAVKDRANNAATRAECFIYFSFIKLMTTQKTGEF
ncbi:MAG: hypothetical protein KGL01_05330, partial [Betaproteobacteria bacterium]|nr:hypothetical protein [Betaproteobacteria bacterium]